MYFLQGTKSIIRPKNDISVSSEMILKCKKYCDSLNIQFLYLPMPNKESVYYKLVPYNKQPNYLFKLDSALKKVNIETINTLSIYNNSINKNPTKLLYHLDDTHWNVNGVKLIADSVSKYIISKKIN